MTREARLKLIKVCHRAVLRREGKPAPLTGDEMREIGHRLELGEYPSDLAKEFGTSPRKIIRVGVNKRFYAGLPTYGDIGLSAIQRRFVEGL